jgi:non-ribosomal peptide synthase protein (TIGR01720 family)
VSWRILFEDLDTAYQQAARGEPVDLGAKTTSFRDWSRRLHKFVADGEMDHELDHWSAALDGCELPVDHPSARTGTPPSTVQIGLTASETDALLRGAPTAYRTRVNDVLLAALAKALSSWTDRETVTIDLEGHGREELGDRDEPADLSRTVGWFTTIYPVSLTVPEGAGPRELAKAVRRQLRTVPGNGLGFGALRHLGSPEVRERLDGEAPQIVFNYLGQWDQHGGTDSGLYRAVHDSLGQDSDPTDRGPHLLEVVGAVGDGELRFSWYFHPDRHARSTVERVAGDFADALRWFAQDCGRWA